MIRGRKVILGISGGIAAYKAAELLRLMVKEGAEVWTVMTRSATEFVAPLTFHALSGHPVRVGLFGAGQTGAIEHIELADRADLAVVAPATANVIAKMAHGIADDMLTTTLLAVRCPVVVCPAMNVNMYAHPAVQGNLDILRKRGVGVVEPDEGGLACGWEGKGRLADPERILEALREALTPHDMEGEHVLVTAGPTWEALDPVRFISNRSSGKMGFALARVARRRGAQVTLVSGPTHLQPPYGVSFVPVTSAQEMYGAVMGKLEHATVVLKAAAVSDFRPARSEEEKIKKKGTELLSLSLERTPDILSAVGERKGGRIVVGFAAETRDLLRYAQEKLRQKNLDMIVANDVMRPGAGFQVDTNLVTLLHRDGTVEELPQMSKEEVAVAVLDRVVGYRARGRTGGDPKEAGEG
jgi:phosphopantothenoylcysteine decarboxylase/phosphopantothenate--cysteine ligase